MEFSTSTILIVIGIVLIIGLQLGLIIKVMQLLKRKPKRPVEEVLSQEDREKLKRVAADHFEAAMVRELKHFEQDLAKTSQSLLTDLHAQVETSDKAISLAASELTVHLRGEYEVLLNNALSQIKAQLAIGETNLQNFTVTQAQALADLVESRKQIVINRVDTQLADILANYLNSSLEQLDLSDQEHLIMAKLEEIKPMLKADLARVK
ncbi:MAG: hypothetical protein WCI47_00600 [bacterium]